MSYKVTSLVLSRKVGGPTRKIILLAMGDVANHDGSGVWISNSTIANQSEVTRETVSRNLKKMVSEGLIKAVGKKRCETGFTVIYNLNLSALKSLPKSTCDLKSHVDQGVILTPPRCDSDAVQGVTQDHTNHPVNPSINKDIDKSISINDSFKERFNLIADRCDLPKIRSICKRRSSQIKAREKEFGEGVLFEVLEKVPRSDFLTGKTDPPFVVTFDWILKPANFIKILEGNYENRKTKNDTGIINTNKNSRPSLAKRESLDRAALAAIQSYQP